MIIAQHVILLNSIKYMEWLNEAPRSQNDALLPKRKLQHVIVHRSYPHQCREHGCGLCTTLMLFAVVYDVL